MRFLVDESCDVALGNALIHAGHDVLEVRKERCGADDEWVVNLAVSENLILLTEDKDFGWLIYAHGHKAIGVIFLRYPVTVRYQIAHDLVELIKQQNEKLIGCFVTITPKRIRIARLPQKQNS
jgi:predicted nuclease of predicted toxin-antitoxin system